MKSYIVTIALITSCGLFGMEQFQPRQRPAKSNLEKSFDGCLSHGVRGLLWGGAFFGFRNYLQSQADLQNKSYLYGCKHSDTDPADGTIEQFGLMRLGYLYSGYRTLKHTAGFMMNSVMLGSEMAGRVNSKVGPLTERVKSKVDPFADLGARVQDAFK